MPSVHVTDVLLFWSCLPPTGDGDMCKVNVRKNKSNKIEAYRFIEILLVQHF